MLGNSRCWLNSTGLDLKGIDMACSSDVICRNYTITYCFILIVYKNNGNFPGSASKLDERVFGLNNFSFLFSDRLLELNDAKGKGHETLGIERSIETIAGASYTLTEGGSIVIDFAGLISDADGDVLTLSFTNLKNGKLTKNPGASPELGRRSTYTYTPKREFSGTETFTYTVSDGKLTTTAIITLTVLPKRDHDDNGHSDHNHHDNGRHKGFEHSTHNGYPDYDDERCATLTLQSVHPSNEQRNEGRQDAIVINRQDSDTVAKVDWSGQAPTLGKLKKDDWVAEQLTARPKEQSLAELTGLVVKMKR